MQPTQKVVRAQQCHHCLGVVVISQPPDEAGALGVLTLQPTPSFHLESSSSKPFVAIIRCAELCSKRTFTIVGSPNTRYLSATLCNSHLKPVPAHSDVPLPAPLLSLSLAATAELPEVKTYAELYWRVFLEANSPTISRLNS